VSVETRDSIDESRLALDGRQLTACLTWPSGPLARLSVVPETDSTNSDALAAIRSGARVPHFSAFVADFQRAGRGRSGRTWETPAGTSLTMSIVLRPEVARTAFVWVPMLAGLAVVRALAGLGLRARLKWPNDVVLDSGDGEDVPGWGTDRKVAGILCEVELDAVVVGIGVNVSQLASELPVPHATSLQVAGATSLARGALMGRIVRELDAILLAWQRDPAMAHDLVARACATVGESIIVEIPGAAPLSGTAVGLSADGGLELRLEDGQIRTVLAGDVRIRAAR
jgi:BirA family transcriptional regulator, biotin operon repressor / biotin---[acetyl-CoA-carboxylase] ligase